MTDTQEDSVKETPGVVLGDRCTQEELLTFMVDRFGKDPLAWAFTCPSCGDVATGQDWRDALEGVDEPPTNRLGQECLGRASLLGGAPPRGCDWAAYGLLRGPVLVTLPHGGEMACFRPGPAAA